MTAMHWYAKTIGDSTTNAVAARAGIVYTTLSRQLQARKLTPETVAAVARAYGVDPINGLIAAGLLTEDDVRRRGIKAALADATDKEIADEVYRRLVEGRAGAEITDGQVLDFPVSGGVYDPREEVAAYDAELTPEEEQELENETP